MQRRLERGLSRQPWPPLVAVTAGHWTWWFLACGYCLRQLGIAPKMMVTLTQHFSRIADSGDKILDAVLTVSPPPCLCISAKRFTTSWHGLREFLQNSYAASTSISISPTSIYTSKSSWISIREASRLSNVSIASFSMMSETSGALRTSSNPREALVTHPRAAVLFFNKFVFHRHFTVTRCLANRIVKATATDSCTQTMCTTVSTQTTLNGDFTQTQKHRLASTYNNFSWNVRLAASIVWPYNNTQH